MNTKALSVTCALLLAACAAYSQPAPPEEGGPDAPPEMSEGAPPPPPYGHHGQGGPRRGPNGRRPESITDAQEQELMGFLKANRPNMHEHLSMAKQAAPHMYHEKLAEIWQHMYSDPEIREHFVKQSKAEQAVQDAMAQYKRAAPKDQPALKQKLTAAVGDLFDADVAQKELQVRKMQSEIAKLKEKISKRREQKDKYVAKRVEQLTGAGSDWEW